MNSELYDELVTTAHFDDRYWVSHLNGRVTPITALQNEHLISCIQMVLRGKDHTDSIIPAWCKNKIPALVSEAKRRGIYEQYESSNRINEGWDA